MSSGSDFSQMTDNEVFAAAARVADPTDGSVAIIAEANRRRRAAQNNIQSAEVTMSPDPKCTEVVVRDIKMSFGSMVVFMVKWVLASIPALIILTLIAVAIAAVAGGLFAGSLR